MDQELHRIAVVVVVVVVETFHLNPGWIVCSQEQQRKILRANTLFLSTFCIEMAQSIQSSKAPLVSVDPNKQVVEQGFPLYLSKNKNRCMMLCPIRPYFQFILTVYHFTSSCAVLSRGPSD